MTSTMSKSEQLRKLILDNLDTLEGDGGGFGVNSPPDFELTARDYLEFAEKELNNTDNHSLINCVGHLKRAVDCQLDTFLHVFNLFDLFRKRNLKFEKKLEFLKAAGVFSSRSLTRLNTIRNRMEHDYEVPKVTDIESYFDLVAAFVSVLELTAILQTEVEFSKEGGSGLLIDGHLSIKYQIDSPSILAVWRYKEEDVRLVAEAKDEIEDFAFFFKALILLSQRWVNLTSDSYLISQLSK
jgi:hypothetical protein